MKVFVVLLALPFAIMADTGSFTSFSGFGQQFSHGVARPHGAPAAAPVHPVPAPAPAPVYPKPVPAPAYPQPAPYKPAPYQPAPYQPAPYQPAPYQPAPSYGYEQPKHNCSIQDVTEVADVCTPAFEVQCMNENLAIKKIVDKEFCYTVTRTVCTESIQEIPNEICSFTYQQKQEDTTARSVEVTFRKDTQTQMVTVCQPGYGGGYGGYGGYGHNYCKEVAQETSFNVPVVTPIDVPVKVAYPEPVKTCTNKPISLPRVTCQDLAEQKCITVPEVEDDIETVEKCVTRLGAPACQKIELTLPKQVCVELVYGYAQEIYPH